MSISVIVLDDEQRAIILETLSFAAAFLDQRAMRVDPDGVVSKAAKLQRTKAQNVAFQLALGPIPSFDGLDASEQAHVVALAEAFVSARQEHLRVITLEQLLAYLIARRRPAEAPSIAAKEETL